MKTVFKRQAAFQAKKLALVWVLFPVVGLQAQNLSELYQASTRYDATYSAARAQAIASRARGEQAKAVVYPSVNLSVGQSRTHQEVVPDTGASTSRSFGLRSASVALTQPLYRPANWASFEQGKRQVMLADTVLAGADQDIMIRLAQAYFEVLAAQDNLVFIGAQKSLITEQLAAAKRNFEVGTSTITDSREAQARFDLMLAQELVAQNDLQVKQLALENVAGLSAIKPKPLLPSAQLPADMGGSMEEWVAKAVAQSPNVLQARLALEVAKLELDKASAAHQPTVDLTASYGANDNLGGSSSSTVGSRVNAASFGLALNWPLFAGFAHQNRILEASALVDKAQADLLVAERAVGQATRTSYLGKLSLVGQIKALQAAEVSSQSSLDANRLGYQVGVRINIDVLNAQSQLFQTKRDLAKARYDLLVAGLRLRQASGALEVADLNRVNDLLAK